MSKRKGNDMGKIGRITRKSEGKQVEQNKGKPLEGQTVKKAEPQDGKAKAVKTTLYLTAKQYDSLRQMEYEVKQHFQDRTRRYSRAKIISNAIDIMLNDYAENGVDCEAVASLTE